MKTIVTQQVHIEEQKEQDNEFSFTTFTAKQLYITNVTER